jgi:hypothetical protein
MFVEPVNTSDILNVVIKMKGKTSSGHDHIPMKIVKSSIHIIQDALTHIINRSHMTGLIPSPLKIAKVVPVYKSGDDTKLNNYRPISLLPSFSKIFEKIVFNKICKFFNSKNLFYKHQYGFRSNHSTIHPLIHLLNDCAEASNGTPKETTLVVLCDLSKAFDVINRDILLNKLKYYGLRGVIYNWLVSYLSDRFQYVAIDDNNSFKLKVDYGVPQGSILGPLLYLIYVNDIAHSINNGNILSFADDTSFYISSNNIHNLYLNANIEINKLYDWFCANKLSLNPKKTKYIHITPPRMNISTHSHVIKIQEIVLDKICKGSEEKSTKFLGIKIDENLSWCDHIKHINTKISRAIFTIRQCKQFLPLTCMKTLYISLIHPYITYGILAWGNASKSLLYHTSILQKKAIRIISRAHYNSHTDPLFKRLNILKLSDQYEYEIALFMFKYIKGKLPSSFNGIFPYNNEIQDRFQTRQSQLLYIKNYKTEFSGRFPIFKFPHIWNKWCKINPNYLIQSVSQFKHFVKHAQIGTYSDIVRCENPSCKDCT